MVPGPDVLFMRTIDLTYATKRTSPTMRVEDYCVLSPLCRNSTVADADLVSRIKYIRRRWQGRCAELLDGGWAAIASTKHAYARNCPPCSVHVTPKTRPCTLSICPFCYARKIAGLYTRLRQLLAECGPAVRVVSYRHYQGHMADNRTGLYLDSAGGLAGTLTPVLAAHAAVPPAFRRKRLSGTLGGFYLYGLAPRTCEYTSEDGSNGCWYSMHSCVAVMPPAWEAELPGPYVVRTAPTDFTLAWLVGRAFKYRPLWLTAEPYIMAAYLNVTRRIKFLSSFGGIRG